MKDKIRKALTEAIDLAQHLYSDTTRSPRGKHRGVPCSIDGCGRPAWATGLCNAHYIRKKKGSDMDAPIHHRAKGNACRTCQTPIDSHGGWGFCTKHYNTTKKTIIKETLVQAFGGVCESCGQSFPACAYDFHHLEGKDHSMASLISGGYAVNTIIDEAARCQLLCAVCHRIEHFETGDGNE